MPTKKQTVLEKKISEINIVNNKRLSPYLEMINFTARNIDQKPLGTLLSIFEIKDTSEDSAYIVNFLASVAKKTYFSGRKKTATDSFELALSKINLSLAELARHGNVNWIGKIDAVICSITDNQINFSVCGDAKILLLRNNKLLEISANLSSKDDSNNPLKTFTDIASGRLEKNDKLILTTDDITHVFSLSDIEKHALSFSNKKFVRFLKTALINELEIAGTMVVDVFEKNLLPQKINRKQKDKTINAFSNTTFERSGNKKRHPSPSKKNTPANNFVNKKTGHIYIKNSKEKIFLESEKNGFFDFFIFLQEKLFEFGLWLKDRYFKRSFYKTKKIFTSLFKVDYENISKPLKNFLPNIKNFLLSSITTPIFKKKSGLVKKVHFSKEAKYSPKKEQESTNYKKNIFTNFSINKLNFGLIKKISPYIVLALKKNEQYIRKISKILPHIKLIKRNFANLNKKQKLGAITTIIIIFILPYFLLKISSNQQISKSTKNSPDADGKNSLSINPNSEHYQNAKNIFQSKNKIFGIFVFKGKVFVIENKKIISLSDNQKEYLFPNFFKEVKTYSFMKDLNLLFLLDKNNQLISFSPISHKFKKENIIIPENSQISAIKTYLTYIYLLDNKNNQIYRYPRANNGFGDKTNWLKDNTNLKNSIRLAIDGNIFLLNSDNSIVKLSKGKITDFYAKIDKESKIKDIFTNPKLSYIYILDNLNGEIIKLDKNNGEQINFLSNQNLTIANKIWVNDKTIYFLTDNDVFILND